MRDFLNGVIAALLLVSFALIAGNVLVSWQYDKLAKELKATYSVAAENN